MVAIRSDPINGEHESALECNSVRGSLVRRVLLNWWFYRQGVLEVVLGCTP